MSTGSEKKNPSSRISRVIKNLRARLGWTQARLAAALEVTESAVRAWEQSATEPSGLNLYRLSQIAKTTDLEIARELLEAAQYKRFSGFLGPTAVPETVAPGTKSEEPAPSDLVSIPLLGKIAAGSPVLNQDEVEDWFPFRASFIEKLQRAVVPTAFYSPRLILLKVDKKDGSSMEPTLHPGDLILIDRGDSNPPFQRRNIYAVRSGDGLTLKRISLQHHRLILRPDNVDYDPMIVDLDPGETASSMVVGRVAWHATTFI